tara:strand:- start:207 stop:1121 length:915 start_codon:yes stop_codon:yes gene_type:complete
MNSIPWVEKYRPSELSKVVLNDENRIILNNIISMKHFPNLLFYGPPGTGKTTAMVNLISEYQKDISMRKSLCIHLNASDERGIDTIRYQISNFVNSNGLFNSNGTKFIILDEVDYMTKSAQLGLKYLIENSKKNVRFCLICNYISKIDYSLQNLFMKLKFHKLPEEHIRTLLQTVIDNEKLNINIKNIENIQSYFESDIRSMINYLQTNENNINIITYDTWESLLYKDITFKELEKKINKLSLNYNIDKYSVIKGYIEYMVTNNKCKINNILLNKIETIYRNIDMCNDNNISYITLKLLELYNL